MKKLIVFAAVAAAALMGNASTVKWSVTNIYTADSDGAGSTATKAAAGSYYVMCFLTSELSLEDANTLIANKDMSGLSGKATYQGTTTGSGTYASAFYDGNWGADETVSIYAVVLNASSVDSATYAAISSSASSYTFPDNATDKNLAVNMKTVTQGSWTSVASSDVPEPTSALLLMLGAAGLALKRRKA